MAKKQDNEIKRELTPQEWDTVIALYLQGDDPKDIVKKFPKCKISVQTINKKMKNNHISLAKQDIRDKFLDTVTEQIIEDKVDFTKKVLKSYGRSLELINTVIQSYEDEGSMGIPAKAKLTAYNLDMLVTAIGKVQAGTRVALGMDKDGNLTMREPEILTIEGLDLKKV